MAKKPLSFSEQIVGRKCPPNAKYMDTYMAGYVIDAEEGKFGAKFTPSDSWMRPSHKKARQSGYIRLLDKWSIMGSKAMDRWHLTEKGKEAALESYLKVQEMNLARNQWAKEFNVKLKEWRNKSEDNTDENSTPKP